MDPSGDPAKLVVVLALGVTLIGLLHGQESTVKIPMFVLSASPTEDAVERTRTAGAQAYLNKPIRLQTLVEIIGKFAAG